MTERRAIEDRLAELYAARVRGDLDAIGEGVRRLRNVSGRWPPTMRAHCRPSTPKVMAAR